MICATSTPSARNVSRIVRSGRNVETAAAARQRQSKAGIVLKDRLGADEILKMHAAVGPVTGDRPDFLDEGRRAATMNMRLARLGEMIPEILNLPWIAAIEMQRQPITEKRCKLVRIGSLPMLLAQ